MLTRSRKKNHAGGEYAEHLSRFGPSGSKWVDLCAVVHSFMDYFDLTAPLLCARIVDMLDQLNNAGRPMDEYFFWPDVQDGLKDMFTRTNFASGQGGFFPEVKSRPERYILRRRPEFRAWLQMLRQHGKFLFVITGSHVDFAGHVASFALGDDWKDLFDIVIFFARKPSFFVERRPFWRCQGAKEVDSLEGWEDLETGEYYSQGNWKDFDEFLEYCTQWQPSDCIYFGDNVLQDVLAPIRFTTNIDSVAVCEEMLAEGMINKPGCVHQHAEYLVSSVFGSYFYVPDPRVNRTSKLLMDRASSFRTPPLSSSSLSNSSAGSNRGEEEAPRAAAATPAHRASSFRTAAGGDARRHRMAATRSLDVATPTPHSPDAAAATHNAEAVLGPARINTLWASFIRDNAKMCIPDLDVLTEYPIDFKFPAFAKNRRGEVINSGFFPADPISLHN